MQFYPCPPKIGDFYPYALTPTASSWKIIYGSVTYVYDKDFLTWKSSHRTGIDKKFPLDVSQHDF